MGNPRPRLLGELAAALIAALLFGLLAMLVRSGETTAFDAAVRGGVHAGSFPALTWAMRALTDLGEAVFLITFGALAVWRLIAMGRRREAGFLVLAGLGGEALDQALKEWFRRPRPVAYFGVSPENYSFPSGHAMVSLCFYLALAEIVIEEEWPPGHRLLARAIAVALSLLIGFSRIYLGVHYPTDVLAGYAAAIVWLAVLRSLQKWRHRA